MTNEGDHELYRIGDLTLDVGARLLTRDGAVVPLPPKTFELFAELVRKAPGVVRRQELLDTVWAHELVNDEALTQRVMLLRRALQDDPKEPRFIASAPRWGYRLVAPVERVTAQPPTPQPGSPQPAAPPSVPERRADDSTVTRLRALVTSTRRRDRWLIGSTIALAAVIAAGVAALALYRGGGRIDSVAIAPFANGDAAGSSEVLCDGIPLSVTQALSQVPGLRVIAASTMARFHGTKLDPQRLGREVGVGAVLTGTLRRRGEDLQVTAELVDVADGRALWSDRYLRNAADVFAIQDEISQEIARSLKLKLSAADRTRLARRSTVNVDAYELYIKGRYFWNKRAQGGFEDAIACFRKAIEKDPTYALAYSGLADCYALQSAMEYGVVAPHEAMPKARGAAHKALEIDPDLGEAHASLGLVLWLFEYDRGAAEREFRRAIDLNPGYPSAHQWYAEMLAEQGRGSAARSEMARAGELDPLSLAIATDIGLMEYYERDFDSAIRQYRAALAMDPNFGQAALGLGLAYLGAGRPDDAVEVFEGINRLTEGSPPTLAALGYACAVAGRRDEAVALLERLKGIATQRFVPSYYMAGIYLGLGDRDHAFEWFERACAERCSLLGTLKVDAVFDPLRGDPRFAALLRCVRLPE
jgi:TolB-like protein/DNA-binding winged helix-turn-helix (wHTH) protein/Tfp pilus assembly protein PilF